MKGKIWVFKTSLIKLEGTRIMCKKTKHRSIYRWKHKDSTARNRYKKGLERGQSKSLISTINVQRNCNAKKWVDAKLIKSSPWVPFSICSFFFNFFISWRLITLQYCSGFCHTLKWISHGFTYVLKYRIISSNWKRAKFKCGIKKNSICEIQIIRLKSMS